MIMMTYCTDHRVKARPMARISGKTRIRVKARPTARIRSKARPTARIGFGGRALPLNRGEEASEIHVVAHLLIALEYGIPGPGFGLGAVS